MTNNNIRLHLAKIQRWSLDRTVKTSPGTASKINLANHNNKREVFHLLSNAELAYDLVKNPDAANMVYIGAIRLSPCGLFANEIARACKLNRGA